jgi:hypothetical protein
MPSILKKCVELYCVVEHSYLACFPFRPISLLSPHLDPKQQSSTPPYFLIAKERKTERNFFQNQQ